MKTTDERRLCIRNIRMVTSGSAAENAWVVVKGRTVAAVGTGEAVAHTGSDSVLDGRGHWLLPGFIDLHVHGGNGSDVMDGASRSIETIGRFHVVHGTTGWLPTTLTAPADAIVRALQAVAEANPQAAGARILGVHLEGPFIAESRKGAQNQAFIQEPTVASCTRIINAVPGLVRKMTLAPELPGALEVIRCLTANGVIPSIGHTDASAEVTRRALAAGARHGTHLFNAMRGLHHRDAGAAGVLLGSDEVTCELIADGLHVHPDVLKLAFRLKGPDRICLITDAMAATGRPDGVYQLGGLDVTVEDGVPYLTDGHHLAGSTLTMDVAFRKMVGEVGVSMTDGVRMASTTPARELGLGERKGDIRPGFDADLVLLDESLQVCRVWVEGTEVYRR